MNKIGISKSKKNAGVYVLSGVFSTGVKIITGFIILRWIIPEDLGTWQSFTVYVGYLNLLTLGITSGINRELPYWLGKGDTEEAIDKLKTAGAYILYLSSSLFLLILLLALIFYFSGVLSFPLSVMFFAAFSTSTLNIQINFLAATYRSARSFGLLSRLQFVVSFIYLLLLPLVYFYNLWGYIAYQILSLIVLFSGYYRFRPYKVKYNFKKHQFVELIKIGLPIYIWNYLAEISRTIPRLILVLFSTPLAVGLYSPAENVNNAMLNVAAYINKYVSPNIAYRYGKSDDRKVAVSFSLKAVFYVSILMTICALLLFFLIPPLFRGLFPNYIESILPTQILVFSGVFYAVNSLLHLTLANLKEFAPFKYIISLRIVYICIFSVIVYKITSNFLISVSIGSLLSEVFNSISYFYALNKNKDE